MMNVAIVIIVVVFVALLCMSTTREGFGGWTRNCGGNYGCCSSPPYSVLPPSWIGRLDQGNGLLGDDVLSGYNFYNAY